MQIKDVEKLKAWLLTKLEPLCDADPAALAKYVVALLRKDKPKSALKELCVDQLEVFLSKETASFVDRLFRSLESESYLTGQDPKTPPSTPTPPSRPSTREGEDAQSTASSASLHSGGGGGGGGERRYSEDLRSREVDDDDRDFRRSRRGLKPGEGRMRGGRVRRGGGRGSEGGTVSREPDSSTGRSRKGMETEGNWSRSMVTTSGDQRGKRKRWEGEGGGGVSSTGGRGGEGGGRRSMGTKDKAAAWQEEKSDSRSRRSWQHQSHSHSSSSDSDSSTSSRGRGTKRARTEWPERGGRPVGSAAGGEGGGGGLAGERRRRCKDYDERGFCMLGDQCPFDHGVDPVIIGNSIPTYPAPPPLLGIPSLPLTKPGFLVPPSNMPGRISPTESTTDGYNPEEPALTPASTTSSSSSTPAFLPTPLIPPTLPLRPSFPPPPPPPHLAGIPPLPPLPHMGPFPPSLPPITSTHHFIQPVPRRPRPHQPGPHPPHQPTDTLIVRKIPREQNTITKLSSHFEKFGTIVNLTVWYGGDPEGALVQFSNPFEARKAHDSAEAVLNNRFIRIYYLRKDPPFSTHQLKETILETPTNVAVAAIHSPASSYHTPNLSTTGPTHSSLKMTHEAIPTISTPHSVTLSSSTSTTPTLTTPQVTPLPVTKEPPHAHPPQQSYVSTYSSARAPQMHARQKKGREPEESAEVIQKRLELQKKTRDLLQKQIAQQKLLISKLEVGGKHLPAEEKEKIKKTLKSLSASIVKLNKMATAAMEMKHKQTPPPHKPSPQPPLPSTALKEKAQALRKEAHQLGLLSSPSQPLSTATPTSRAPGSGRGPMKDLRTVLDHKPKRLLVMNVEDKEQLTVYFESFGGLLQVEVDPENDKNLIFTFRHAHIAQKVAKKSSTFNGKPLIMKWYTPKPPPPAQAPVSAATPQPASPVAPPPHHSAPSTLPPPSVDTCTKPTVNISSEQVATPTLPTPTLTKLDPAELHLVEDDEDEESEGRSWRR